MWWGHAEDELCLGMWVVPAMFPYPGAGPAGHRLSPSRLAFTGVTASWQASLWWGVTGRRFEILGLGFIIVDWRNKFPISLQA